MNERILKLAKEAGLSYIPSSNNGPLRVEYLFPELEKFAELIINNCIQSLIDRKYDNPYDSATMLVNQGLQTGVEVISEKFGVQQ